MLPYRDSRFTIALVVIFFLIVLFYGIFEARGQILGPTITLSQRVALVHDQYLLIEGQAARISSLTMNGNPVSVTEDGAFKEPYLLAEGYNRIVLDAKDAYGHSTERVLEIMYEPTATSSTQALPAAGAPANGSMAPTQ